MTSAVNLIVRERVRRSVPWWAEGALKLALGSLPVQYSLLRKMSLAKHGAMDLPDFAFNTFRKHFNAAGLDVKPGDGFVSLELGPGDSLFTALIAKAHGATQSIHVDVGAFANRDPEMYREMADYLVERGLKGVPNLSGAGSLDEVLHACSAHYGTDGLQSLRAIPDGSVHFAFSNAVLQAIPRRELTATMHELRQILHPKGASVHSIDLRDMMGQSLNHLRFSARVWESRFFRNAAFYTNRLRLIEFIELFRQAGFEEKLSEVNRWPELPIRRKSLAAPYCDMPEDELLPATIRIVLHPAGQSTGDPTTTTTTTRLSE